MDTETRPLNLWSVSKMVFSSIYEFPSTMIPFAGITVLELALLALLVVIPFLPQTGALAALVGRWWGAVFLHYPANYALLPELFSTAVRLTGVTFGVFLTGAAISAINQTQVSSSPRWGFSLKKAYRRYYRLALVWAFLLLLSASIVNGTTLAHALFGQARGSGVAAYLLSALIQAPFIFAMPAIVIENRKVFNAIDRSLSVFSAYPATTVALVALSSAVFVPAQRYYDTIPVLVNSTAPELVVFVMAVKIVLANAAIFAATSCATMLLVALRKIEKQG
jgi:hypothetical protein